MIKWIKDFWEFLADCVRKWVPLVTGTFVVGVIVFYEHWTQNALPSKTSIIILLISIAISCFLAWRSRFRKVLELENMLKPKIKCSFNMNDAGCVRKTKFNENVRNNYFRIKIEADGTEHIKSCSGSLVKIQKDGKVLSEGDNLDLVIAPGYDERKDHTKKDILDGKPEYIDILTVLENNSILIATERFKMPSTRDWNSLFSNNGDYELDIVISSLNSKSVKMRVVFNWKGNWETATLRDITNQ